MDIEVREIEDIKVTIFMWWPRRFAERVILCEEGGPPSRGNEIAFFRGDVLCWANVRRFGCAR
jgi:hypothetical protein